MAKPFKGGINHDVRGSKSDGPAFLADRDAYVEVEAPPAAAMARD